MGKFQVHRSDGNASQLSDYLRGHGASVEPLGRPLDVLIGYQRVTVIAEFKMPNGKLRPGQVAFLNTFRGMAAVLRCEADCDLLLGEMRTIAMKSSRGGDARAPGGIPRRPRGCEYGELRSDSQRRWSKLAGSARGSYGCVADESEG